MLALFSPFLDEPLLRLVSLMDHTPGQRQFVDLEKHREYYQGRLRLTDAEMRRYVEDKMRARGEYGERNRTALLEALAGRDITLASHDDADPGPYRRGGARRPWRSPSSPRPSKPPKPPAGTA